MLGAVCTWRWKTVFNIRDGRDAKEESTKKFEAYKEISRPRVN